MLATSVNQEMANVAGDTGWSVGHNGPMDKDANSRLKELMEARGLRSADLAEALAEQPSTFSKWFNGKRNIPRHHVPRLAELLSCEVATLLQPVGSPIPGPIAPKSNVNPEREAPDLPSRVDMPRDVPVFGTAAGSDGDGAFEMNQGEPVDFVRRGPGIMLSRHVFAIYVEGESMSPWREPGQIVYVDPARPPKIGDYVVLVVDGYRRGDAPQSYLKRLVRRSAEKTIVHQYNPDMDLTFETDRVKRLYRVLSLEEVMGI